MERGKEIFLMLASTAMINLVLYVSDRGLSRARKRSHGAIHSWTTVSNATTASTTDSECDDCHDDDDDCKCIIHVHSL